MKRQPYVKGAALHLTNEEVKSVGVNPFESQLKTKTGFQSYFSVVVDIFALNLDFSL